MTEFESPAPSDRPRARSDIVCQQLEDGFVLIDPREDSVHTLNVSAAFIWDLCDGEHTVQDISERLRSLPGTKGENLLQVAVDAVASLDKLRLYEPPAASEKD